MATKKGVFKRKNSQFYWIRYAGTDGRTVQESTQSTSKKLAEGLLIDRKAEVRAQRVDIKNGIPLTVTKQAEKIELVTFPGLAEKYLNWVKGRQRSAETKAYIIKQLLTEFGDRALRDFSTEQIEQYQTKLMKRGLKNSSCNKSLNILKHMFTKASDWKMITDTMLKDVRKVKLLPENNTRLRYLSREECKNLIDVAEPHLKPIIITAIHTGMRKGEILKLKWEQVDLRHNFILLDETKNGETRQIPINGTLRSTLTGLNRRLDIPYVFVDSESLKPFGDVKRAFHTALRRAGITDFVFHDLRHTCASHLVMAGVDITTVSRILGHKSLKMTLRYTHLAPKHMTEAMERFDGHIKNLRTEHLLNIEAI